MRLCVILIKPKEDKFLMIKVNFTHRLRATLLLFMWIYQSLDIFLTVVYIQILLDIHVLYFHILEEQAHHLPTY